MDVLDFADSHFLHYHFPNDLRYACLGIGVAYHRTPGFSDDSDHARYAVLFGFVRQCLHPSRMARANGFGAMVRNDHIIGLGDCGNALGVNGSLFVDCVDCVDWLIEWSQKKA